MFSEIKKIMWMPAAAMLLFVSCAKDDETKPAPVPPPPVTGQIGTPPASFTKKVLLEYHTASWCGTCVDAEVKRDQVMNAYNGKVIPVAIHQSDGMQSPAFMTLNTTFGSNPAFGMVNRVPSLGTVLLNRTQWMSNTTSQTSGTAKCGLAIRSSVSGTTASVEVQASFRENLTGAHTLTVYIIENEVTGTGSGYDQVNSYNSDASSPFYQMGNPITGYRHKYVLRKAVTATLGDAIDAAKLVTGGLLKKNYTVDVSGFNKDNVYIVAFVTKSGTSATTYQVLNAQQARLATLKNWD